MPLRRPLVWILSAAVIAACSSSTDSSAPIPGLQVKVQNIAFTSTTNATTNPAVDTIAVGDTVSWVWTGTGGTSHSVESDPPTGADPSFTSSPTKTGNGKVYTFVFTVAGEYEYDCAVHGSAMTGRIVVQ
jgi:plastocyanin